MSNTSYNPYLTAQAQFDKVAEQLGLDEATRELLRQPMRDFYFTIPVRMDDGSVRIFKGFRIQHNDARGPARRHRSIQPRPSIRYAPFQCG